MEFCHTPVLLDEVIANLAIKEDGVYADGTLGGAGHALAVCSRLGKDGRFFGIDRDKDAVRASKKRLEAYQDKVTVERGNYTEMAKILHEHGVFGADGILLDLGVSSFQLDNGERGFSYRADAPLDMRMDDRQFLRAADVVNEYTESELACVIFDYGEEKFAKNIARHIVEERQKEPILTTQRLSEIVCQAIPMKARRTGGHPAKRTFQAIRIEVNGELDALRLGLDELIGLLNTKGRFCVITFHSLEDRIVKQAFRTAENPCTCPKDFPVCVCGKKSLGRQITRKPIVPTEAETEKNPRAKSAKLRVFERV